MGRICRLIVIGMTLLCLSSITAVADSPESQILFDRGKAHHDGVGAVQDFDLARIYYEQAAALGNTDAQLNLGYLYFVGEGVSKNYVVARNWYRAAAEAGDLSARENLVVMNRKGLGLPKVRTKAHATATGKPPKSLSLEISNQASKLTPASKTAPNAPLVKQPVPDKISTLREPESVTDVGMADNDISAEVIPLRPSDTNPSTASPPQRHTEAAINPTVMRVGLLGVAFLLLILCVESYRALQKAKLQREARDLARQFFEPNRRLLREFYFRYPSVNRGFGDPNSGCATAISVLIVRFVLAKKDKGLNVEHVLPKNLSSKIISFVETYPAKSRHVAYTIMPNVLKLIQSDIRAFDTEHEALLDSSSIFNVISAKPRKQKWTPRIVKTG